ncbi:MAG: hypothetical protein RL757_2085 [Bacteroidota bacterium]
MNKKCFVLFAGLCVSTTCFGQLTLAKMPPPSISPSFSRFSDVKLPVLPSFATLQAPLVFRAENLPFFCRLEYKANLKLAAPVFFRLGSLDYVNELEGKCTRR